MRHRTRRRRRPNSSPGLHDFPAWFKNGHGSKTGTHLRANPRLRPRKRVPASCLSPFLNHALTMVRSRLQMQSEPGTSLGTPYCCSSPTPEARRPDSFTGFGCHRPIQSIFRPDQRGMANPHPGVFRVERSHAKPARNARPGETTGTRTAQSGSPKPYRPQRRRVRRRPVAGRSPAAGP